MSCRMKLRQLESHLEEVEVFARPKIFLEQYPTRPHIAAALLHTAEASFGDLEGRSVADLGCGCGVLSLGAAMLGAGAVTGFDVDADALEVFKENIEAFEVDNVDAVQLDVKTLLDELERSSAEEAGEAAGLGHRLYKRFDTVLMNPPFGTKAGNRGLDLCFARAGTLMARGAVYSLHKSSTREHVLRRADAAWGVRAEVVAELRFDLPASYKHHRRDSVDIWVDFIRFSWEDRTKK